MWYGHIHTHTHARTHTHATYTHTHTHTHTHTLTQHIGICHIYLCEGGHTTQLYYNGAKTNQTKGKSEMDHSGGTSYFSYQLCVQQFLYEVHINIICIMITYVSIQCRNCSNIYFIMACNTLIRVNSMDVPQISRLSHKCCIFIGTRSGYYYRLRQPVLAYQTAQ